MNPADLRIWDPEQAALFVRVTARMSATLVAASVFVAARRIGGPRDLRTADLATFGALVASQTIHFFCVGLLAAATGGANVRVRGGWILNVVIAALFYTACVAILRAKQRPTPRWPTARARSTEVVPTAALWLVFAQAYVGRLLQSWLFVALAAGLVGSLTWLLTEAFRSPTASATQTLSG